MHEQKVELTDTRTFAGSVGDIKVVRNRPTLRLKLALERKKGAPLTLVCERYEPLGSRLLKR
jgi:hypothetical protein